MIARQPIRFLSMLALLAALTGGGVARAETPVIVFAAASLKNALDDVAEQFENATGLGVSLSYGGSSALARQIQYGAPAQIFLSANVSWMDILQDEALLQPDTRVDLLTNRLVLIAGVGTDVSLTIEPEMDLLDALQGGRLAMALVDAVPAGIYARAALQSLGVWGQVSDHIAQTDNVRAALRLVAVGEAPLGVVYATDASAEPLVRVVGAFPADTHPAILYPVARLEHGDNDASRELYDFLIGPEARAVFDRHGFGVPGGDGS